jgi:8-oxo-dGTP pyrophosphatase MutT (NUDIX family)
MSLVRVWRELARRKLLDCRVFEVEESTAVSPVDGSSHDFYRVRNGDWVQIIPVTADDEIVMIRQYRHGAGAIVLEIPGGLVDPGETPAEAAARECLEETGYRVTVLEPVASINPNPAIHTAPLHSFHAPGVEKTADVCNSDTEQTEVVLVPLDSVADLLRSGEIDHALVASTLWRFLYDRCRSV